MAAKIITAEAIVRKNCLLRLKPEFIFDASFFIDVRAQPIVAQQCKRPGRLYRTARYLEGEGAPAASTCNSGRGLGKCDRDLVYADSNSDSDAKLK